MSRADRFTLTSKQLIVYSDFTDNFDINPVTGLLARVTNEESIKQSLRNLVLTGLGERPYKPLVGSKLRASLFSLSDPTVVNTIQSTLQHTLTQEPRASIQRLQVIPNFDNNSINIVIAFTSVNIPAQTFTLNLVLNLLR